MAATRRPGREAPSTTAQQWGLKEPLRARRTLDVTGDPGRDVFFVRSPVTGDVRGVPLREARKLILDSNWEPVVEPSAVRLLERQVLRERASALAAATTGAYRGLSGGLSSFVQPQGDEPGAEALRAQGEEYSGSELAGEVAGTLLPFAGPLKGARLATVPGLAEAAGAGVTRALPGGKLLTRAAGVGLEGGIIGSTYTAGETAIEDTPLTAQKLMGGFLAGALPGAIIGGGIGAAESLGSRLALRGGLARDDVLRPGLTDADMMRIAQREHGVADPGLIQDFQSAVLRDPALSPDFLAMARDKGPVGQQVRREMLEGGEAREAAYRRAAVGLDKINEVDDLALDGWTAGENKRRLVERWMDGLVDQPDVGAMLADTARVRSSDEALARLSKKDTAAPEHAGMAAANRALSEAEDQLEALRRAQAGERDPARWEELALASSEAEGAVAALRTAQEQAEGQWRSAFQVSDRPQAVDNMVALIKAAVKKDKSLGDELIVKLGGRPGKGPLYGWEPVVRRGLTGADENVIRVVGESLEAASPRARKALEGKSGPRAWRDQPLQLLDDIGKEADVLMGQPAGVLGEARSRAKKVRDLILDARNRLSKGDRVEAHIALDNLKKQLSPYALPDQWLSVNDNVARLVREAYEDLRTTLERPDLWGQKAAAAQRDMNALFHARLARKGEYFDNFFEDAGVPHPRNPWTNAKRASPDKVKKALAGVINESDSPEFGSYKAHVAETRGLLQKMREHYALDEGALGKVDDGLRAVDDAERSFSDAVHYARREAQGNALFNARGNIVPGYMKWVGMGFLGPVGFAAGALAERLANPGQAIFQRAVLERALRGSEGRIARAVTKLITGKETRFMGLGVTNLAARASVSMSREKDPEKRASTYANTLSELTKLSTPEAATAAATESLPFAVGTLPGAPGYMGLSLANAANYIVQHAPVKPKWTPLGVQVPTPSDSEMERFERIYMGALDPISAIEDAAEGDGSRDAMLAAETVAPELVGEVRQLLLQELAETGYRNSYENRVDLSIVLGMPLDPTMEPGYIVAQQMTHAARFKTQPDNRRTYAESGVNKAHRSSKSDQVEADEPPK